MTTTAQTFNAEVAENAESGLFFLRALRDLRVKILS